MFKEVNVNISGGVDDEQCPIECICGHGKEYWSFVIGISKTDTEECPKCGRKYYFSNSIKIYMEEPDV